MQCELCRWQNCPDTSCTVIQNPLEKDKDPVPIYFEMNNCKLECPKVIYDRDQYVTRRLSADRDHADEQLHGDRCHLRKHHLRPDRRHCRDGQALQGLLFRIHFVQIKLIDQPRLCLAVAWPEEDGVHPGEQIEAGMIRRILTL